MSWIAWIILGILAGFIAEKITKNDMGLLMNLIVGLIGAVLGGWVFGLLGLSSGGGFVGSLVVATVGAILLLVIVNAVKRSS